MKRYLRFILLALTGILSGACSDINKPVTEADHSIEVKGESVFHVKYEGEIISVEIEANCDWNISKTNDKGDAISWIKSDVSSGRGSKVFNIKVLPNNTQKERSGIVNIYSDQVTEYIDIIQEGNPNPEPEPEPDDPGTTPDPTPDPEPAELKLEFDFTDADAMKGWPQVLAASSDPAATFTCPYTIDGIVYDFISAQPIGASGLQWPYYNADEKAMVFPKSRYLGLPAVSEYKLIKVEFEIQAGTTSKYLIGTERTSDSETPGVVKGGEEQSDETKTKFIFELSETAPGAQYWLRCKSKAPRVTSMTLTYSK